MRVTEILCSFRLVLKGQTGKEILESLRSEFTEMVLVNNFALSDTERNSSEPVVAGDIADWPLLSKTFTKSTDSQVSGKWWTLLFY